VALIQASLGTNSSKEVDCSLLGEGAISEGNRSLVNNKREGFLPFGRLVLLLEKSAAYNTPACTGIGSSVYKIVLSRWSSV